MEYEDLFSTSRELMYMVDELRVKDMKNECEIRTLKSKVNILEKRLDEATSDLSQTTELLTNTTN